LEDEDKRKLDRVRKLKELAADEDTKLLCEELACEYVSHLLEKKSKDASRRRERKFLLRFLGPGKKFFLKEGKEESHKFETYAKAAAEYLALQEEVIKRPREWLKFEKEKVDERDWPSYLLAFTRQIVQD